MSNRIVVIYCGRCILKGEKLGYEYQIENSNETMAFPSKIGKYGVIGMRTEVTKTDTGVSAPYNDLGLTKDQNFINVHSVKDRAAYDQYELAKMLRKKPTTSYDTAVEMLRKQINCLSPSQRQSFLNRLLIDVNKR